MHNFPELWNIFSWVPVGNCFLSYFRQLIISLALRKCKKDYKIGKIMLIIILIKGFCTRKTEIGQFLIGFWLNYIKRLSITCWLYLKLNREMHFSLPSIKCSMALPTFQLQPSTVLLPELSLTLWLLHARWWSEAGRSHWTCDWWQWKTHLSVALWILLSACYWKVQYYDCFMLSAVHHGVTMPLRSLESTPEATIGNIISWLVVFQ